MANLSPLEIIKPVKWLLGKWNSISAIGKYPTVKPFVFCEKLEFSCVGLPVLNYVSRTWYNNAPNHIESGFLLVEPGTYNVAFLLAHSFGLLTREEGVAGCRELNTCTTNITRVTYAKVPPVCKIVRHYKMCGEKLEMVLLMQTDKTPLAEHLRAIYKKEC